MSRKERGLCSHGPHNFGAFSVFFLVFAKTWDSPQKMAGGPFQNGRGFFELQKFFSNIINHLKNLKKIQLKSACRVLSTRIFFSQKNFCRYTPILLTFIIYYIFILRILQSIHNVLSFDIKGNSTVLSILC